MPCYETTGTGIAVALLRAETGRNPDDPDLTGLIGELATHEPATASADNLALLATWAATEHLASSPETTNETTHPPSH
ncbi:MmyB family transcriptional regulator [Nocardia exalbida]|uniref:MmyB family transcriptional regulator n=1 Tax=Nocardia exalbida TaxID=290231 RepID=UPI0002D4FF61|nr:hypothetical protein [Nocardia exalbida]